MSRDEARQILDLAKAGSIVPTHYITLALVMTGDLTPFRAHQMERLKAEESRAPAHLEEVA